MADVRAHAGVPVAAQFGGFGAPTMCAPIVVDTATGYIYTLKTGDVVVLAGAGGAGSGDMLKSENLSGLANYTTARSNMGLGALATLSAVVTNANLTGPVTSTGNATAFAAGVLTSGYFTPTITAETNTTITMSDIKWCRVNVDTVVMSGQFTSDPALAATVTSFEFDLPVASNIGAVSDVSGTAFCGAIAGMGAEVIGVIANDTAKVRWISSDITSQTWSWIAEARVL